LFATATPVSGAAATKALIGAHTDKAIPSMWPANDAKVKVFTDFLWQCLTPVFVLVCILCLVGNFGLSGELDEKHDEIMTGFDRIGVHEPGPHTDLLGISGEYQNPVGGWFSVLTLTCVPIYIAVLSTEVRKRHFLSHLYIKFIILPRQARDKHRKNSKKVPFSVLVR
jgi:hypothetical protein